MNIITSNFLFLLTITFAFSACGDADDSAPTEAANELETAPEFDTGPSSSCDFNIVAPDSETDISEIPWQVALVGEGAQFCGGVIIDESWVLTALHCVGPMVRAESVQIRAGITQLVGPTDPNLQEKQVQEIVRYPGGLGGGSFGGDIALLRLATPLALNDSTVQAIPIATPEDEQFFPPGTPATASGWGLTTGDDDPPCNQGSNTLRATTMPIITNGSAAEIIEEIKAAEDASAQELGEDSGEDDEILRLTDTTSEMIVTTSGRLGMSTCSGDSGGPLTINSPAGPLLVGLNSWALACGIPNLPLHFTRVSWFYDWILSIITPDSPPFDASDRSCVSLNSCGDVTPSGCSCDPSCQQTGDCCFDYRLACTEDPPGSDEFFGF